MRLTGGVVGATMACVLAACGSDAADDGAVPTLSWYVGPDRLDAALLAETCTDQADGQYRVEVEELPKDVTARHALLVRRLLANDTSIDLLSLDTAFTAEFAAARFLAPVPDDQVAAFSEGIAPVALAAATHDERLVAVPWFLDPQVLWYRGNTAERAGLDPSKPISWDDLITAAQRLGVTVQIEDRDGSGLVEWVNALVAGGGGTLVGGEGRAAKVGLTSDAGRNAASVVELYDEAGVGPGPSPDALTGFAGTDGGFLIASTSAIADPVLSTVQSDMVAAAYPVIGNTSVAPLAGAALAVPAHAPDRDASFAAIGCLTSPPVLQQIMSGPQHSASRLSTYDDPGVKAAFRGGTVARDALASGATVPATPLWSVVADALVETWSPVGDVTQSSTPDDSQAEVEAAVQGRIR